MRLALLAVGCCLAAPSVFAQTTGLFYRQLNQYYAESEPARKSELKNSLAKMAVGEELKRAAASDPQLTFVMSWFTVEAGIPPAPTSNAKEEAAVVGGIVVALAGATLASTKLRRRAGR